MDLAGALADLASLHGEHVHEIPGGRVVQNFEPGMPDESLIANSALIPFVGRQVVIARNRALGWSWMSETLEEGESYLDALRRGCREELGAEVSGYEVFGSLRSHLYRDEPHLPHLPHPVSHRVIGFGDVQITGPPEPASDLDVDQIDEVRVCELEEALGLLDDGDRRMHDLYLMAHRLRSAG